MDINEFLNAMNQVDVNGLVEVAKQVTQNVDLSSIDRIVPSVSEGWLGWSSGPIYPPSEY